MTQTELFELIDSWEISLLEKDYLKHRVVKPAPGNRRKRLRKYGLEHLKRTLDAFAGREPFEDIPKLSQQMFYEAAQGMKRLLDGVAGDAEDPEIIIFLADFVMPNPPAGVVPYLQGRRTAPPEGWDEFMERCRTRYETDPTPEQTHEDVKAATLDRLEGWKQYLLSKKESDRGDIDAKVTAVSQILDQPIELTLENVDNYCAASGDEQLVSAWNRFKYWCLNLGGGLPMPTEQDAPVELEPEAEKILVLDPALFVPDPTPSSRQEVFVPDPEPASTPDDPYGIGDVFEAMSNGNKPLVEMDAPTPIFDEDGEEIPPPPKGQPLYTNTTLVEGSFGIKPDPEPAPEPAPTPEPEQQHAATNPVPERYESRIEVIRKMRETLSHLSTAHAKLAEAQAEIGKTLEKFSETMETLLNL